MRAVAALRRSGILFGVTALAAGCAGLLGGDAPAPTFYVWRDNGAATPAPQTSAQRLILAPTSVVAFYDTQRIVFSQTPGTRGRYQFAWWTERPGKRFDVLLLERLAQRNAFVTVADMTSATRGDLVLTAFILDIHHDNRQPPGVAYVAVLAELTDLRSRFLLARRTFVAQPPLSDGNPAAAVTAFGAAVTQLLDDLVPWVESEAAKTAPH